MMLKKNRVEEFGIQPDETFQNSLAMTPPNMGAKAQEWAGKHAAYTVMSCYDNIPDGVIDRLSEFLLERQSDRRGGYWIHYIRTVPIEYRHNTKD